MTRILVVNASPNVDTSYSRSLTKHYLDGLESAGHDISVVTRDVAETPLPHLDQATIGAFFTLPADRSEDQKALVALSDTLVGELQDADIVIVGTPMHNFGITSGLKAWIDHVARVGVTFRYGENGPEGLLGGRKVIAMTASGGDYTPSSPFASLNHVTPYLKTFFAFVGIEDVTVIEAPATAKGDDGAEAARSAVDALVADFEPAIRKAA